MPSVKYSFGIPSLRPLMFPFSIVDRPAFELSIDVESNGSLPAMALNSNAASLLVLVIGPI